MTADEMARGAVTLNRNIVCFNGQIWWSESSEVPAFGVEKEEGRWLSLDKFQALQVLAAKASALESERDALKAKTEGYERALRFYADKESYVWYANHGSEWAGGGLRGKIIDDDGAKARQALAGGAKEG